MFSAAEKTNQPATVVQQKAQQQSFFRKAEEESFFGGNERPSFFNAPVQPKLAVSSPDDPQEKEADAVAETVMRMPDPVTSISASSDEKLDKKEEDEVQPKIEAPAISKISRKEDEVEEIQAKHISTIYRMTDESFDSGFGDSYSAGNGATGTISRKKSGTYHSDIIQRSGRSPPRESIPFEQALSSSKGSGSALPGNTREFMESRFNADFSSVRIHTGATAQSMNSNIHAQAFAHGNDIYFNEGKFSPHTESGGTLLAHELTHTIQQGAIKLKSSGKNIIYPSLDKNNQLRSDSKTTAPISTAIQQANKETGNARNRASSGPVPYQQVNNGNKNDNRAPDNKAPPVTIADQKIKHDGGADSQKNKIGRLDGKKDRAEKKKSKPKPVQKAGVEKTKSKGRSHKAAKGKKQNAKKRENIKAKPVSQRINASELKLKKGLPAIASPYQRSQHLINAIQNRGFAARENFAVNVSSRSDFIETQLNQQHDTLVQTGAVQEKQLRNTFSSARNRISSVIDDSSQRVSSHGVSQRETLTSSHTSSIENVNTVFDAGNESITNLGNTYSNRSIETANSAANLFQSNVQSAINEVNQIRDSKNSVGDPDPEVAKAKREAGNEVASDTAKKVSEGLSDAMNGLTASGPETAAEFVKQGNEAANQLSEGKAEVDTQINQIFNNATQVIGQMTSGAVQSIEQQRTPIISQFETLEEGIISQLNDEIVQKSSDLQQAGEQIMTMFRQQSEQSLLGADNYITQMSQQISGIHVAENETPVVLGFAEKDISNAYSTLHTSLDSSTQIVTNEIRQQGSQIATAVQSVAPPVMRQVNTSVTQNEVQIQRTETQSISQITEGTNQTLNGANNIISQVSTGLTQQITSIDTNFQQGLSGYNTALLGNVTEGTARAREPVATVDTRITQAQQRAADRARRSWLENQWEDAKEALSDPGFWAGLIVGLVLAVVFVLLIVGTALTGGALLLVLVAGFAVIGAIAAGIGSIIGQATNHSFSGGFDMSRVDWGEVGSAMLIGAAAGAAIAVVAFIAVEGFGVAAMGFGMIAIMSVTSGVIGIITNVITDQPWDKALLFNLALGGLLTWLGAKLLPGGGRPGSGRGPPVEQPPGTRPPVGPRPVEPVPTEPVVPRPVEPNEPVVPRPVEPEPRPTPVEPLPNGWSKFVQRFNEQFSTRLRAFRGTGDRTANPALRGGEGQLFESPTNPLRALKRWFESRIGDMPQSLRLLREAKSSVDADPILSRDMEVVEIHEVNNDWILRDFEPDSIPLRDAVSDPEVAAARQRLIDGLEGTPNSTLRNILGKLRRNSANIHWSPSKQKLIVIDMQ